MHHTFHSRSKQFEIRYQSIQDVMENKYFVVEMIHTNDNISDRIAKLLSREKFEFCRRQMNLDKLTKLKLIK
jgi:predicted transcriptional regulator